MIIFTAANMIYGRYIGALMVQSICSRYQYACYYLAFTFKLYNQILQSLTFQYVNHLTPINARASLSIISCQCSHDKWPLWLKVWSATLRVAHAPGMPTGYWYDTTRHMASTLNSFLTKLRSPKPQFYSVLWILYGETCQNDLAWDTAQNFTEN